MASPAKYQPEPEPSCDPEAPCVLSTGSSQGSCCDFLSLFSLFSVKFGHFKCYPLHQLGPQTIFPGPATLTGTGMGPTRWGGGRGSRHSGRALQFLTY